MNKEFWEKLDKLAEQSEIVIDRPKGSAHPRYPEYIYPHDYGYFKDTVSADDHEIDCWTGSLVEKKVVGIVVTVDLEKKDSEIKVLIGCSDNDMNDIENVHNRGQLSGMLIKR